MAVENPLSQQDLESINKGIQDAADAKELIQMAQAAGLDVESFKARTDEAAAKLLRIKQAFFPGK